MKSIWQYEYLLSEYSLYYYHIMQYLAIYECVPINRTFAQMNPHENTYMYSVNSVGQLPHKLV